MLVSMTGFGRAQGHYDEKKIAVEIKSLNSKQFDLNIKLPSAYREKEMAVRQLLAAKLDRGKIDLSIQIETGETDKRIGLNSALARAYWKEIKTFSDDLGVEANGEILRSVLTMPDVWSTDKSELDSQEWVIIEGLIAEASENLQAFRNTEGENLGADIRARVESIDALREGCVQHLPKRLLAVRERLAKHIKDLTLGDEVEQNRLEQEIVYYLEKLDITEENTRLAQHCAFFLETMDSPDMIGKKLGFITQEMGREINTMGSKANYVPIQKLVVDMKDELEKVKEQLLNIC